MRLHPLALCPIFILCAAQPLSAQAPADTLTVNASGLKSDRGAVRCALYGAKLADDFPTNPKRAQQVRAPIKARGATCQFTGLAPGDYAVAIFHDEDDDSVLDTNFVGIPKEGMGASRDPKGSFGPPSFDDAKISYRGGALTISVKIGY